jgi:predicted ferric reductase
VTGSLAPELPAPTPEAGVSRRRDRSRLAVSAALWLFVIGNGVAVLWIWGSGGGDGLAYHWHTFDQALLGIGRLTALLAGYLALIEILLLARLPFLERLVGFDRLTVWHRWNGYVVFDLILAHVVCSVWGYARQDGNSWFSEYWNWLTLPLPRSSSFGAGGGGIGVAAGSASLGGSPTVSATSPYPGIITATIGTFLLVLVVVTSLVVVRRRLPYEWWYAIHFTAYAGIALAWFHMIPDGNDLVLQHVAADYWRALYALTLALVLYYRVLRPLVRALRYDLRVQEVTDEGAGVVSVRMTGRRLDQLGARPGQFFFWRFLTPGFWYTHHPFSLSEAPRGDTFRITVKGLGDHTRRLVGVPVGTRVFAEGPFGAFTEDRRVARNALLVAGGIGITPIRSLLERLDGDLVVVYRVVSSEELVFRDELDRLAAERGVRIEYLVGDHTAPEGRDLLSPGHLTELVPDLAERDVYLCGPVGLVDRIVPSLRHAGVPRRHLHVERFAL